MQQVITPNDLDSEFAVIGGKLNLKLLPTLYQDGATGAIGVVAKNYLQVRRVTSNQIVGINQDVIFNQQVAANGITYNTATGVASAPGGKVYRLTAVLHAQNFSTTTGWLRFNLVDGGSNAVLGGSVPLEVRAFTTSTAIFAAGQVDLLYAPAANWTVKLRCTASSGATCQVRFDAYSGLFIQEL